MYYETLYDGFMEQYTMLLWKRQKDMHLIKIQHDISILIIGCVRVCVCVRDGNGSCMRTLPDVL